jgi:PIN domain nuclease of toxin-antitoxin system
MDRVAKRFSVAALVKRLTGSCSIRAAPRGRALPCAASQLAADLLLGPHRDLWDRLIMAQAVVEDLTIVTIDPIFQDYVVPTWW